MSVEGILLRRERLHLGWSQEGLCKGICAVSYLSKIEQGRAAASEEIVRQLFARIGITWQGAPQTLAPLRAQVEAAYDALFSFRMEEFQGSVKALEPQEALLRYSPFALDAMLLTALSQQPHEALPQELEACMDARQLALQRALQTGFRKPSRSIRGRISTTSPGTPPRSTEEIIRRRWSCFRPALSLRPRRAVPI